MRKDIDGLFEVFHVPFYTAETVSELVDRPVILLLADTVCVLQQPAPSLVQPFRCVHCLLHLPTNETQNEDITKLMNYRPRIKNSKGQGHLKKGTLRKGQEVLTFGGIQGHSKRAPIVTTTFQWGTYTGLPQGTKATRKKGHLFLALSVQIFGRASEAMVLDGLGLIRALELKYAAKSERRTSSIAKYKSCLVLY